MTSKSDIPKTIIKGSGVVNLDADFINSGGQVLFMDKDCFLTGLDSYPLMLFVVPEFNFERLPASLYRDIFKVKKIILQHSFLADSEKSNSYNLPNWLSNFNEVEEVTLRRANLDGLDILLDLPIKHFVFSDVTYTNMDRMIRVLKSFKELIEVHCDAILYDSLINVVEKTSLKFNIQVIQEEEH